MTDTELAVEDRLMSATEVVRRRLAACNPASCGLSEYGQRYLQDHLDLLPYTLSTAARLIGTALGPGKWSERTLVDYGAGLGIMGLVARAAGVGRVVMCDLLPESCENASRLAAALDLTPDAIVAGDLPDLVRACHADGRSPHALVSYDVIEHIYDLRAHVGMLPGLTDGPLRVVHASSANACNPRIARHLMAGHRRIEHIGIPAGRGKRPTDSSEPFLVLRRRLLAQANPAILDSELDLLAERSRGLAGRDLIRFAHAWPDGPILSYRCEHPTNTCDPVTGNWHERLIDQNLLLNWFVAAGFSARVESGRYGPQGGTTARWVRAALNRAIAALPVAGLRFAPYFTVIADLPVGHRAPMSAADVTRLPI